LNKLFGFRKPKEKPSDSLRRLTAVQKNPDVIATQLPFASLAKS
jgi:hypothetical protein